MANAWDVALTTTTTGAQNTANRVLLCATRYANYAVTPKVREVATVVGPTTYPVEVLDWAYLGKYYMAKSIGAILISKNGTFNTDFNVEFVGDDGTALFGLAFGTGDWLNAET